MCDTERSKAKNFILCRLNALNACEIVIALMKKVGKKRSTILSLSSCKFFFSEIKSLIPESVYVTINAERIEAEKITCILSKLLCHSCSQVLKRDKTIASIRWWRWYLELKRLRQQCMHITWDTERS